MLTSLHWEFPNIESLADECFSTDSQPMGARILNEIFEKMEKDKLFANPQGKRSFAVPEKLWADEAKVIRLWNLLHVETSPEAKYDRVLNQAGAFREAAIVESTLVRKWSFLVMENFEHKNI